MLLPHAKPAEIGLDPEQLEVAYRLLEQWTQGPDAPIPGAALLVGRKGRVVPPRFFGRQGPEPDAEPIRPDGMFLIASVTKPVTYVCGMKLVERGELNLSEPVTHYIPDFAAHHKEDVLVNQLFTHTSGLPDMLENNTQLRQQHAPLSRFIQGAIRDTVPLFPPGTNLSYQSMGTLIVAELVQRISGKSIHDLMRQEVFEPLGLKSISLGSRGLDRERLIRVQVPENLKDSDYGWNSRYWQELGAPWGGMFAAPEDYAVLCQHMLKNGGDLLSPAAATMMTTNRLHDYPDLPEPIRRTQPWGLGWQLNPTGTRKSWSDLLDRNVFGHTGATGTLVWVDRAREGFCVLFTTAMWSHSSWRLVKISSAVAAAFR